MAKNTMGKTRPISEPYSVHFGYLCGMEVQWRVLKHYQGPEQEAKNPYARVYTWAHSAATGPRGEYGDMYWTDLKDTEPGCVKCFCAVECCNCGGKVEVWHVRG